MKKGPPYDRNIPACENAFIASSSTSPIPVLSPVPPPFLSCACALTCEHGIPVLFALSCFCAKGRHIRAISLKSPPSHVESVLTPSDDAILPDLLQSAAVSAAAALDDTWTSAPSGSSLLGFPVPLPFYLPCTALFLLAAFSQMRRSLFFSPFRLSSLNKVKKS